jgi:predicted O-linked N-acetylglucosamine transferase (SPINDLY family)
MIQASDHVQNQFVEARALHQQGRVAQARDIYLTILKINPQHADSLHMLGVMAAQSGNFSEAATLISEALAVRPDDVDAHYNLGLAFTRLNRLDEAVASFDRASALNPRIADIHYSRANVLRDMKRPEQALQSYDKAIAVNPDFMKAHVHRGGVLRKLGRLQDALKAYARALEVTPDHAPTYAAQGAVFTDLKQHQAALASYDQAIRYAPEYAEAHNNRGVALMALNRPDAALPSFAEAMRLKPAMVDAHYNHGNALFEMKDYAGAAQSYAYALKLNPSFPYLLGRQVHARMQTCDWRNIDVELAELERKLKNGERCIPPFPALVLFDDPALHAAAARIWTEHKRPPSAELGPIAMRPRGKKMSVGYFSTDFRIHPVALLIAELIERHDRARFEIVGFSMGRNTGDHLRKRMEKAFDKFFDVSGSSDREIAELARRENIDIAVDLGGYTNDSRTGMFTMGAAPIQVGYLGFPGTLGAPYMDYMIADETVIPAQHKHHCTEKVVSMPDSYLATDSQRKVSEKVFTRADVGLPSKGFIFCCLNNAYKITPGVFDSWMRILKQTEGSALWLLEDNAVASQNLRDAATRTGINADRIIFADRVSNAEYLARFPLADLFLDTLPCNAATTANDALWMGVPIVTCLGEGFSGRAAASMLRAVGLPELVTTTREQYEALAVKLASDPAQLGALKQRLADNRASAPLFNSTRFARHLEQAYEQMMARYNACLAPDHIIIEPML